MRLHSGTVIQTTFVAADADGNLCDAMPLRIELTEFNREAFVDAFEKIAAKRAELEAADAAKRALVDDTATGFPTQRGLLPDSAGLVDGDPLGDPRA